MRTLNPGEQDRTSNGTLYVVDMRSHSLTYSLELPSATTPYRFPIRVTIEYQVENPRLMIDNNISDTEQLVIKLSEPVLQRQSRDIPIEKYKTLLVTLENAITQKLLSSAGLSLNSSIINIDQHNDYWQSTILPLLKLRQASHIELFPTQDRNYNFNVMANVAYSIADTSLLNESPDVAEKVVWQQIAKQVRRMCGEYTFRQAREAEQDIENNISKQSFVSFGIEIQSVNISIDIDKKAQDLLDFEHQKMLEQSKNDLEEMRRKYKGNTAEFYKQFVGINDPVRKSLVAYILSQNPDDANSILKYIDDREKVLVERQLSVLQTLVNAGDMWDEKTQVAIQDILNALKGASIGLPGIVSSPSHQIEDKNKSDSVNDSDIITINEEDIDNGNSHRNKSEGNESDEPTFKPFDAD